MNDKKNTLYPTLLNLLTAPKEIHKNKPSWFSLSSDQIQRFILQFDELKKNEV